MKNGVSYKKNGVAQKCTYLFSVDIKMCCSLVIILYIIMIILHYFQLELLSERTAFMLRIFLKLHFFPLWERYDPACNSSNKKSNAYNIRFLLLKSLHCNEIFLSENVLFKMASVKLAAVTSSIKGFHVYRRSPEIGEN